MAGKIYFFLLIICGILCQDVIGVFSEDIGESHTLVRRKRVINLEPNGDTPLQSGNAPYVANIREFPANTTICVGAILSRHTVITAALCADYLNVSSIKILVGSAYSFRGSSHNVIGKEIHIGERHEGRWDGVALLTVEPAFILGGHTATIDLHVGPLLPGTRATIFGWGCNPTAPRGTNYRLRLRSITLPIMRHRDCVNIYRNRIMITDKDICTFNENKRCGHTDLGAPLVIDNKLAGIYLRRASTQGHINPDVFLVVQHLEYSQWIRNNIVHNI